MGRSNRGRQPSILVRVLRGTMWLAAGLITALVLVVGGWIYSVLDVTPEERAQIRARLEPKPCQKTETIRVKINETRFQVPREYVWGLVPLNDEGMRVEQWCQEPEEEFITIKSLVFGSPAHTMSQNGLPVPRIMEPYFTADFTLYYRASPERLLYFKDTPLGLPFDSEFELASIPDSTSSFIISKHYTFPNGRPFVWQCRGFQRRQSAASVFCNTLYDFIESDFYVSYQFYLKQPEWFKSKESIVPMDHWVEMDERIREFINSLIYNDQ